MGRPALHSSDVLLDAAARLFAAGGARGLTMTAVAREAGAPSGSVYHRFPDRPALLAALWLRTARRFQDGYLATLGDPPTPFGAVGAAAWTVDWCRGHLPEAVVLQAGTAAFGVDQWPQGARDQAAELETDLRSRIRAVTHAVATRAGRPADQVAFAMLDLPLAAVRRHLAVGKPPPMKVTAMVRDMVALILGVEVGA